MLAQCEDGELRADLPLVYIVRIPGFVSLVCRRHRSVDFPGIQVIVQGRLTVSRFLATTRFHR